MQEAASLEQVETASAACLILALIELLLLPLIAQPPRDKQDQAGQQPVDPSRIEVNPDKIESAAQFPSNEHNRSNEAGPSSRPAKLTGQRAIATGHAKCSG